MCPGPLLAVADGGSIRVGPRQEPYLQQRVVNDFVYKEKLHSPATNAMFFSVLFFFTLPAGSLITKFTLRFELIQQLYGHYQKIINTTYIYSGVESKTCPPIGSKKKPATYYYRVGERSRKERGSRTGNRARQKTQSDRTRFGLWVDMMDET